MTLNFGDDFLCHRKVGVSEISTESALVSYGGLPEINARIRNYIPLPRDGTG
ncbi:MAG: hypothetical protein QGG15_04740 [Dehalococcoidales bacterium]|jgi:hypothetical protein|nr:hypothetical protein [Dehalococcoidales bacterium]MDP6738309.1 hypothetical protein [Dehalococcoidales bacterium]